MRIVRSIQIVEALFGPEWARAAFCFALVLPALGFVRAPHLKWTRGVVGEINRGQTAFTLRESKTGHAIVVHWGAETRFWVEPYRRLEKGIAFSPAALNEGSEVRVLLKQSGEELRAQRIIRARAAQSEKEK